MSDLLAVARQRLASSPTERAPGVERTRGAARQLWLLPDDAHEVVLAGPAETGKTYGCLTWLHEQLRAHPKAQGIMLRRQYSDLIGSALQTYTEQVLEWPDFPAGSSPEGVTVYGGHKPQWFDYPNGARLWLAGMDNPGDALSSERDYIYANQAEELAARDWQVLLTRATGRAGHVPHPRVLGDANPGPPGHWILRRAASGRLRKLDSRHEDNPALFADDGQLTEQGRRTMGVLDGLEGVERDRLRDGLWVAAEGAVYTLLPEHLGSDLYTPGKPCELAIDPSNGAGPYACLVIQQHGRRVLVVDEFYYAAGTDEHLDDWLRASRYQHLIADGISDPALPVTAWRLSQKGWPVRALDKPKDIVADINIVRDLMAVDPVSKQAPLVIDRDRCPMTLDEFAQYRWQKPPASAPERNVPQLPEDAHNHCLKALGYWAKAKRASGGPPVAVPPPTTAALFGPR